MTDQIAIIDYEMGNLASVANGFESIGQHAVVTQDKDLIAQAPALVLPGVGAFGDGMKHLEQLGLIPVLEKAVLEEKKPFLGICLGMQLLARVSEERGEHAGLGWINAHVNKIEPESPEFKVPHMGWNTLKWASKGDLFAETEDPAVVYFVHSYHMVVDPSESDVVSSTVWHGAELTASVQKDNIFGTQFHPEKSQQTGIQLLKNFAEIAACLKSA